MLREGDLDYLFWRLGRCTSGTMSDTWRSTALSLWRSDFESSDSSIRIVDCRVFGVAKQGGYTMSQSHGPTCQCLHVVLGTLGGGQAVWGVQEPKVTMDKRGKLARALRPKLLQHVHHAEMPAEVRVECRLI